MDTVTVAIQTESPYWPTEMVADLRNAAETLHYPMRSVGYWDIRTGDHRCPQALIGGGCPHHLPPDDPKRVDYEATVTSDLDGVLDVHFPHAQVHIYLA